MVHFRSIFYLVGWLIITLAGAMVPSAILDFIDQSPEYKSYLLSQIVMVFLGVLLIFSNKSSSDIDLDKRDSFLLTGSAWIFAIMFSSLPFLLSSNTESITDAFFETVSGLTTTGSTILTDLDHLPRGILLWRSMLQWLGGIGIIVMALTILTDMRVGGLELFQSESSDRSEKFLPRIAQIAKVIFMTYFVLTVLCFVSLILLNVSWFDAVCHSLTTISTGGFSTHNASVGFFNSPLVEYVLVIFMWSGGVTQLLFGYFFTRNWKSFFKDDQVKAYVKISFFFVIVMCIWNVMHQTGDVFSIITKSFFNVISASTTTGFSSENYSSWGGFAWVVFFIAPFIGGCTGSTSGAIKVFRVQVLWRITSIHLKRLRRPHAVYLAKYNGKQVSESVFDSVASFVMLFIFCYIFFCFLLSFLGLDFQTAMSSSAAMLTNLGPGLGDQIGPSSTYASFSPSVKWVFMIAMLLGRLELVTIIILLMPSFWRD